MNDDAPLGTFEEQVMLAVLRMHEEAYGMAVRREIGRVTERELSIGAVYATLDRLEAKGLVDSTRGQGEGSRRVFAVTGDLVQTPTTAACPEGITRATVLEICAAEGIPCDVRDLSLAELYRADVDATGQPMKDAQGNDVWLCDKDNAELVIRDDDKAETVEKRLVEYEQNTNPIIDTFRQRGELAEINGEQPSTQVAEQIETVLQPVLKPSPSLA